MLTPAEVDKIKAAIAASTSVQDIERLEKALSEGSLSGVKDLVGKGSTGSVLDALWTSAAPQPLLQADEPKRPSAVAPISRKTPRELVEEEQAKRRFTESVQLMESVVSNMYPRISSSVISHDGWRSAPDHTDGRKKLLVVDCGTAVCISDGAYMDDVVVRLVVTDFLTDRTLLDIEISPPASSEAVDLRPSLTGIEIISEETAVSLDTALNELFQFMSKDTVVATYNAFNCASALGLNHSKWLPISDLVTIDPIKKRNGEGKFHIRASLSPVQYMEAFLGELVHDRFRHIPQHDRMKETNLGAVRILKTLARKPTVSLPIVIDPPRRLQTLFMSHIPSNWSEEELRTVLPSAADVEPVEFFLDTKENAWRGECHISFRSQRDLEEAFAKLTTCTDVFVGWEWTAAGQVTEESVKALGSDFGPVVAVRIHTKYLHAPRVLPGKEESRPFGFVSLARYQDALSMASDPRQIEKDGVDYHVKISKKPITAFKRVPLGDGEDFIEAFIM